MLFSFHTWIGLILWYKVQAGRFGADEGIGPKFIVTSEFCYSERSEESFFHNPRERAFADAQDDSKSERLFEVLRRKIFA